MGCHFILIPPGIFSVACCFDIFMFVENHDLIHIVPLHPLVAHTLGLPELFTDRVQGLQRTRMRSAWRRMLHTDRWCWLVSDALVVLSVLITELHITLGALESHTASHTGWVHLAVLEHLQEIKKYLTKNLLISAAF